MFAKIKDRFTRSSTNTKVAIIAASVVFLIGFGFWFKLEFLEPGNYLVSEQVAPDGSFRIDAYGKDWRGYVFTPPDAPHKTCLIVTGTNKMEMECFDKKEVGNK